MRNYFLFAFALSIGLFAQNPVVRSTDPRGVTGQLLQSNGAASDPSFVDPIISFNYVTLFNGVAATGTATGTAIRIPTLSTVGSLVITGTGITGSPSGCQIQLQLRTQVGAPTSATIATQAFTPGNTYQSFAITPAAASISADTMLAVYTCSAYPSGGTLVVGFDPITPVSLVGTPAVSLSQYTPVTGRMPVDGSGVTQPVSGTFWQSTQPVSVASLPLPSTASTDRTTAGGPSSARLSDGAAFYDATKTGQLPSALVSGRLDVNVGNTPTVTANAGTNLNTSALALEAGGNLATIAGGVRAEDAASADAHTGIGALAVRKATPANTSGTDGDYEFLQMSGGRLWTSTTIDAALPTGSNTIGNVTLAAETTKVIGTVRNLGNAGAAFDAATAAAPPANVVYMGGLTSGATGGLVTGITVCDQFANINQTAGAQIITGVTSRRIYICAYNLVSATAQNVAIVAGTGTVCATNTVPVPGTSGGSTAATGYNLAANAGIAHGSGFGAIAKTTVDANNVCLLQSSTGQVSGGIAYAIY